MIGFVTWTEEKPPRRAEERTILRMRFCAADILRRERTPAAVLRGRARAAARALSRAGVVRAVFPEDFAFLPAFAKQNVVPVDVLPLYRRLAGEWLRAGLAARGVSGAAMAALCADRLTGEAVRAVTELCLRYRYVLLDVPEGGEELARQLRREFGVSLILRPAAGQLAAADGALLFSPRSELRGPVTLALYDGAQPPENVRMRLPALEEQLPQGCRRDQLLAALWGAGALRPEQIELSLEGPLSPAGAKN